VRPETEDVAVDLHELAYESGSVVQPELVAIGFMIRRNREMWQISAAEHTNISQLARREKEKSCPFSSALSSVLC
jgi:hypothetical protein